MRGRGGEKLRGEKEFDLFGEDGDVLVEGVGGADVSAGHPRLSGSAGGELALFKDQS